MEGLHYNEVFCRLYKTFFFFFQQHSEGFFFFLLSFWTLYPCFHFGTGICLEFINVIYFWYFFFPFLTRVNLSTAKH